MRLPETYLLTAPADLDNQMGKLIHSDQLISKLQKINPKICAPCPDNFDWWYPMRKFGVTCIWLGQPPGKDQYITDARWVLQRQKKISSMRYGPIPEFTQLDDRGRLICKGWRAIFNKVIASGAATKKQIERAFGVVLDYDKSVTHCRRCLRLGKRVRATSAGNLCNLHRKIGKFAQRQQESKKEIAWVKEHPKPQTNKVYSL